MLILSGDLDHWVCSVTGDHTAAERDENSVALSLSPLIQPSLCKWAGQGTKAAAISRQIRLPDLGHVFSSAFLRRFLPEPNQVQSMIADGQINEAERVIALLYKAHPNSLTTLSLHRQIAGSTLASTGSALASVHR